MSIEHCKPLTIEDVIPSLEIFLPLTTSQRTSLFVISGDSKWVYGERCIELFEMFSYRLFYGDKVLEALNVSQDTISLMLVFHAKLNNVLFA